MLFPSSLGRLGAWLQRRAGYRTLALEPGASALVLGPNGARVELPRPPLWLMPEGRGSEARAYAVAICAAAVALREHEADLPLSEAWMLAHHELGLPHEEAKAAWEALVATSAATTCTTVKETRP